MSPLLFLLLKRLAIVAFTLAVLLAVGPRLLGELGIVGPTVEDVVKEAAATVEAARTYGASSELEPFAAAETELAQARALAAQGHGRDARQAAKRAKAHAILAQREALLRRDQQGRRAAAVVAETDRRLNELEAIYGRVSKGLNKRRVSELISLMKEARQAGAGLVLAYEQRDYARVLAKHEEAFKTLDAVRDAVTKVANETLGSPAPSTR